MSARWFYEIDGREGGPISTVQLQLMANSGMLQPQHKIRKENSEQWSVAGDVRGLFAPSQPVSVPQAFPVNRPVPMATPVGAAPTAGSPAENPMGWQAETPAADPSAAAAFDFFSESSAPAVAMPPPAAKAKGARKPRIPVNASTPPMPEEENPFSFGDESTQTQPAAVPAPPAPLMPARPMALPATPAGSDNPFEFEGAAAEMPLAMAPLQPAATNPASPPARQSAPKKPAPPTPTMTTPAGGTPAIVVEVTGQAVELLPGDEVRLLEGTTVFRLHKAWVYVATKLADETSHTIYLPLQRIDAAILDQRFEAGRKRSEPHSLLIFHSGAVATGLVFQGSDKTYRNFLEKVLLLASHPRHSGGKS